ncbi:MAG: hypothetical protein M5U28_07525 [Sandaracinaceae bacterium]|nr:hypothetical protein [Sandaracinaceae bacterium]
MAAHVTTRCATRSRASGSTSSCSRRRSAARGWRPRRSWRAIEREIDRLTAITEEYLRLARLPAPRLEPRASGDIVLEVGRFVAREMETSMRAAARRGRAGPPARKARTSRRSARRCSTSCATLARP